MGNYQPTGNPRGRPKLPAVVKEHILDVRGFFADTKLDPRSVPLNNICPDCFPNGWEDAPASAVGCAHGTWVNRS